MSNEELLEQVSILLDQKLDQKLEPIKKDIYVLKQKVANLDEKVTDLNGRVLAIGEDIHKVKIKIENEIEPNIRLLAENYVPAAKKYETEVRRLDSLQFDMDVMKKVVADHSAKLAGLVG